MRRDWKAEIARVFQLKIVVGETQGRGKAGVNIL
jgi:hypothetical protein